MTPGQDEEMGAPIKRKSSKEKKDAVSTPATRARTHSNGSTLGAFYQNEAPPSGVRKRRPSRKPKEPLAGKIPVQGMATASKPPRPTPSSAPPTTSGTGSDLGDLAFMAIAGDDIDLSELMGNPPTSKSMGKPPPARSRSRGKPGASNNLPTIVDDSEQHDTTRLDIAGVGAMPARVNSRDRRSVLTDDSLRISEASEMEHDVNEMLSQMNRDNSLFQSDDGNKRSSLLGSAFLDRNNFESTKHKPKQPSQQEDIANFAAMLHSADYGAVSTAAPSHPLKAAAEKNKGTDSFKQASTASSDDASTEEEVFLDEVSVQSSSFLGLLDPTDWLLRDLKYDENGVPYFDPSAEWTLAGFVRHLFFNPIAPEFTSLQQINWAVVIGIVMGFYTAGWKEIIEHSVDIMWKELPEALLEWGFFTELDGAFPLYHWMWICPAFWGGLLSYIFAALPTPIPGQNEWITAVHTKGVQDSETFFLLFVLSTLGMASGLSLGPELPLVLTSGMIGSWLGVQCKQTVLQARVMNITAASAAVGGFFGFPMAGALFVMEIPHRMGLQYFEALSPATIASIVAVLVNRMVTGNDVTGYYSYPFLSTSLPSEIFSSAIIFGLFGAAVGTIYAKTVLQLKGWVHDFFHAPHDDHHDTKEDHGKGEEAQSAEKTPLIAKPDAALDEKLKDNDAPSLGHKISKGFERYLCCVIPYEPHRALAAGVVAGAMAGVIGMFFPHVMFWGEAQLQSMIDKGRTPLPVFGREDEPTAALTHNAFCMIDSEDPEAVKAGFGLGCAFLITFFKIVVTGLSLGTGIIGGHFWGPLFAGCVASHFLVDITQMLDEKVGIGGALAAYPCVAILCTMGSTHVVTFRAHTAIMLILTLTISAFDPNPEGSTNHDLAGVAGDYSAVFPLLVVSVFVSLMVSRQTVFYKAQRSRVDISARPEVLCMPGQEGMPVVVNYDDQLDDYDDYSSDVSDGEYISEGDAVASKLSTENKVTQEDIEKEFSAYNFGAMARAVAEPAAATKNDVVAPASARSGRVASTDSHGSRGVSPLPPRPKSPHSVDVKSSPKATVENSGLGTLSSARLDELLSKPLENTRPTKPRHRRIQSAPDVDFGKRFQRERAGTGGDAGSAAGGGGGGSRHVRSDSIGSQASQKAMRVATIGNLSLEAPSLMDQARLQSATSVIVESRHVRHPSMPRLGRRGHSRQNSASSIGGSSIGPPLQVSVGPGQIAVPPSEVERAYTSAVNQQRAGRSTPGTRLKRNFTTEI